MELSFSGLRQGSQAGVHQCPTTGMQKGSKTGTYFYIHRNISCEGYYLMPFDDLEFEV